MLKNAVGKKWTKTLKPDLRTKSNMYLYSTENLERGKIHPGWESLQACTSKVKKGIIKARMVTGPYLLYAN